MINEKKDKRIVVRVSERDYNLLAYSSKMIGLDVSKLMRMYLDSTINPLKVKISNKEVSYEDIKRVLDSSI